MASPTYRASSRIASLGSAITSITGTEPTGTANGDGVIAVLMIEVGGTSPGTVSTPTGWTPLGSQVATSAYTLNAFYIKRGASAPTYVFPWSTGLNGTFKYAELLLISASGVSAGVIDSYALGTGSTGTQPDPPSATIATADTLSVAVGASWAGWAGGAPTAPTGYTSRLGGSTYDMTVATKTVAATGAENPSAFAAADASDVIVGLTIVFASTAGGALTGSSTLALSASGTLTGAGALAGSSTLALAPAGTLTGAGAIVGSSTLALTASGTLLAPGAMTGATTLAISPSGTLAGSGALVGSSTLALAASGTLANSGGLVIACHGNSLVDAPAGATSWPQVLAGLRPSDTIHQRSVGSAYTEDLTAEFDAQIHPWFESGKINIVCVQEWVDDIHDNPAVNTAVVNNASTTAALVISHMASYVAHAQSKGWLVIVLTCIDCGEYSGIPAYANARSATNTSVRSGGLSSANGIADVAARSELSNAFNSTYFESDTIHTKAAGAAIEADVVNDAINALGAMTSTSALALSASGTLSGAGALAGASALAITPAGTLTASGALVGASTFALAASGTLTNDAPGAMSGAASLSLSATGTLTGAGALVGVSDMTLYASSVFASTRNRYEIGRARRAMRRG